MYVQIFNSNEYDPKFKKNKINIYMAKMSENGKCSAFITSFPTRFFGSFILYNPEI